MHNIILGAEHCETFLVCQKGIAGDVEEGEAICRADGNQPHCYSMTSVWHLAHALTHCHCCWQNNDNTLLVCQPMPSTYPACSILVLKYQMLACAMTNDVQESPSSLSSLHGGQAHLFIRVILAWHWHLASCCLCSERTTRRKHKEAQTVNMADDGQAQPVF